MCRNADAVSGLRSKDAYSAVKSAEFVGSSSRKCPFVPEMRMKGNGEIYSAPEWICPGLEEITQTAFPQVSNRPFGGALDLVDASPQGARVVFILPGNYADEAGMRIGDIIRKVNYRETDSVERFSREAAKWKLGDTVAIFYQRGNLKKQYRITITFND